MSSSELAGIAMRSVAPVYLSSARYAMRTSTSRGSMTLLQLPGRRVGVTCQHVIAAYRERWRSGPAPRFIVGTRAIEPMERLLVEDARRDLAILDLDDTDPTELGDEGYEVAFFVPPGWPLRRPRPGEILRVGGYRRPGTAWRPAHRGDGVESWTPHGPFGLTRVLDVGSENIVCELRWDGPADRSARRGPDVVTALGGLSGGPGFVSRDSVAHFVGIVFAVAEHGGYLRLRPADLIGPDATLGPD